MEAGGSTGDQMKVLQNMKSSQSEDFVVWTFGSRCSICSRPAKEEYRQVYCVRSIK